MILHKLNGDTLAEHAQIKQRIYSSLQGTLGSAVIDLARVA